MLPPGIARANNLLQTIYGNAGAQGHIATGTGPRVASPGSHESPDMACTRRSCPALYRHGPREP